MTSHSHHADALTDAQVLSAAAAFSLLADPTRIKLLWALRVGELDVTSLTAVAGCRTSAASQHLSKLRFAGLVDARREGRRIYYRLRGGHVRRLLTEGLFHADHQITGVPTHS